MARINLQLSANMIPLLFTEGVRGYEVTKDAVPDDARVISMVHNRMTQLDGGVLMIELDSPSTPNDCILVPEVTKHYATEEEDQHATSQDV